MHWVDRGVEPVKLPAIRARHGPKWVRYYRNNSGRKPTDSQWRKLINDLKSPFHGNCGYCETQCRGEVDHFRPKSRFPELVYDWSNWIFSCHDCNHAKLDNWPGRGYVDPSARSRSARPDRFFDFDIGTGMIMPKSNLSAGRHRKAINTIQYFKLNDLHHIKRRITWLWLLSKAINRLDNTDLTFSQLTQNLSSRKVALSSLTRAYFDKNGIDYS